MVGKKVTEILKHGNIHAPYEGKHHLRRQNQIIKDSNHFIHVENRSINLNFNI